MDGLSKYILEQVSCKKLDEQEATEYLSMLEGNMKNDRLCSVAIVGMSVRIHNMRKLEEIWNALIKKQSYKDTNYRERNNILLNCNMFGLTSDRYNNMNIRQKLLLDDIYYALTDAGITLTQVINSNTGVFCRALPDEQMDIKTYSADETVHTSFIVSDILGTQGPSVNFFDRDDSIYDLLHSALKCLANQECDIAIVGDMDVEKTENDDINRGVGGVFILKSLKKAKEDSNHVYAVIRSCLKNFIGRGFVGTKTKDIVRAELIKNALKQADLCKESIQYIEFAGGHLAEHEGVLEQLCKESDSMQVYNVSSLEKENHLTDCLAVLSLIKTILAVYKAVYPPALGYEECISSPIYNSNSVRISKTVEEWHGVSNMRRGCVNFYNRFGSNCSLILESYQENSAESKLELTQRVTSMSLPDYFDLSNQQMSILISQKLKGNCSYNIPRVIFVEGVVDVNRINEVFCTIISRHDALRTSILLYQGRYVQKVNSKVDFQVDYEKKMEGQFNDNILNDFISPFDLSKAPLLRVKVIEFSEKKYAIMLDIHHIIADRQSIIVLMREFVQLYQGRSLEKTHKPYYQYIKWQKEFMQTSAWKKQEEYWLRQYSERLPIINMKTDYERNQFDSFTEATLLHQFSDSVIAKIDSFCISKKVTVNMLMLAVYYTLLFYWLGQERLVVGINTNGRNQEGFEDTIGMFVNTLAVQNEVHGHSRFIDFAYKTKKELILAYANSDYSYEVFIDKLRRNHKDQTISLIKTLFVMQNSDFDSIHLDSSIVKQYDDYIKTDARFDLQINVFHTENKKSNICFIYCKELFSVNTMKKLVNGYISILNQTLDNADILIRDIKVDL